MEPPLVLTREQVRRVDATAMERYGVSGLVLMENAGRGAVDVLLATDGALATGRGSVAILCGKGNNGGDGFVIARHLAIRGVAARVVLLAPPDELTGDARANYDILAHAGVPIADVSAAGPPPALPAWLDREAGGADWLVDAILGTGAVGEPRQPFAAAIEWMNAQRVRRLAVDLPSGLDADSGRASPHTVRADVTCTFVGLKVGFLAPTAAEYLGTVHVVPIGLTRAMAAAACGLEDRPSS